MKKFLVLTLVAAFTLATVVGCSSSTTTSGPKMDGATITSGPKP